MHVKYVTFTFRGAWASDFVAGRFQRRKKKIDNRVANSAEHHFRKNLYSGAHISALFFFTRNQWETEKVGEPPVYFMTAKRIVISLNRKTNKWITK